MEGLADIRDMIRSAFASLLGFGGRLAARVIFMILAGRAYGVEALGVLGQVAAITEIAAAIGVLGLKRSLLDMLSEKHENGQLVEPRIVEALIFALGFGMIISGVLLFIWPYILPNRPDIWAMLFFAVLASILADIALTAIKFKRIVRWDVWARSIGESWGLLFLAIGLLYMGKLGVGLPIAYAGSLFIVAAISGYGLIRTYGFKELVAAHPNLKNIMNIPKQSAPVGLTDIGVMALRRIDLIIMSIFVGPAGTGLYFMVQQLATIQQRLAALFEPMLIPVIARLHNRMDSSRIRAILIGICRWVFIIQLAIVVPMIVFGDYVLSLFNPAFMIGGLVLTIVLIAELIDGTIISVETPLVFSNPKIPPTLLVMTLILEAVVIAILSKIWGVQGAAIGFFLSVLFLNIGRLVALSKSLHIQVINTSYFLPSCLAAILLAFLYGVRKTVSTNHGLFIGLGVALGLLGFIFLIKTFALTKTDKILLRVLRRKRNVQQS